MGILSNVFRLLSTPDDRGVGTRNIAVALTAHPTYSIYGPRYNVQRTLNTGSRGYLYYTQGVLPTGLQGNGSFNAGQLALQSLSKGKVK